MPHDPCSCDPTFTVTHPPAGKTKSPLCPICNTSDGSFVPDIGARGRRRGRRSLRSSDVSGLNLDNTTSTRGEHSHQSRAWALGNVRGRAGGYRRGTLSLAGVSGAVRVALTWEVSVEDIQAELDRYELYWDHSARCTLDRSTAPANRVMPSRRSQA